MEVPLLDGVVVVHSTLMREVLDLVSRIAPSDANVLLTGESGVGKEIVARAIHQLSPRRPHEFVPINCATLSGDTLENELFGHERGAFTSADERKLGVFELAHQGTLFLDEVNEMGVACQAKVLRALERREFRRLGGTRKIKVDVRLVAATNVDLEDAIRARRFREDLFYRLNVIHIRIPPLRQRREAIAPMAQQFLREFCDKYGKRRRMFTEEALTRLTHYPWPGNVRELRNVIERIVIMNPTTTRFDRKHLPPLVHRDGTRRSIGAEFSTLHQARAAYERDYILKKLDDNHGNISRTAEVLGLERSHLYRKMKTLGIAVKE
jgi:two-component system nitrogen regulation response regulator NtrX